MHSLKKASKTVAWAAAFSLVATGLSASAKAQDYFNGGGCGSNVKVRTTGAMANCTLRDPNGVHRFKINGLSTFCTVKTETKNGQPVCPGKQISEQEACKRAGLKAPCVN